MTPLISALAVDPGPLVAAVAAALLLNFPGGRWARRARETGNEAR